MKKIVKRIYEVYEIDKFGEMNLVDVMNDTQESRDYIKSNPDLKYAKWGITEDGDYKIIMCDGYFLSKRIESIIK